MSTLLIRLAGPMQSWGSRSRFTTRATEPAPTKSGVIGLVAAALGLERTASLERFTGLRFGVRIDQPGSVERDFQTAVALNGTSMPLSERYYLADAVFLAALEHPDLGELGVLEAALRHPAFPLYLGRRAFPPAGPLKTWIVEKPLEAALETAPWQASDARQAADPRATVRLEVLVDVDPGAPDAEPIRDAPVSFDPRRREHAWRTVGRRSTLVSNPRRSAVNDPEALRASDGTGSPVPTGPLGHDPMTLLPKAE